MGALKTGGAGRDRTADKGFADLCLTTWRPRRASLHDSTSDLDPLDHSLVVASLPRIVQASGHSALHAGCKHHLCFVGPHAISVTRVPDVGCFPYTRSCFTHVNLRHPEKRPFARLNRFR